jgi:uncharacterized protein DUF3108
MQGWNANLRRRAAARAATFVLIAAGCFAEASHAAPAAELAPFEASFNVNWRGMGAGTARLTLRRVDATRWKYESNNAARGIFKVAIPGTIRQSTELRIENGRIVPQHFLTDDGSEKSKRDSDVRFDWQQGRATGMAEGKNVDVPLQPGLQDSLSVQVALMQELIAGRMPASFVMLDRDEIKEFLYTAEGHDRIETALGSHDTLKYRSRRPDSEHSTVFWCAPELGYMPLKVERQKGTKIEWSMSIATLKRE